MGRRFKFFEKNCCPWSPSKALGELRAQIADVSKALQSVRTFVQAGHMVVFGDGDDESGNYIVNKITGERTTIKDDGVNYLLGLYIAPVHESGFSGRRHKLTLRKTARHVPQQ